MFVNTASKFFPLHNTSPVPHLTLLGTNLLCCSTTLEYSSKSSHISSFLSSLFQVVPQVPQWLHHIVTPKSPWTHRRFTPSLWSQWVNKKSFFMNSALRLIQPKFGTRKKVMESEDKPTVWVWNHALSTNLTRLGTECLLPVPKHKKSALSVSFFWLQDFVTALVTWFQSKMEDFY